MCLHCNIIHQMPINVLINYRDNKYTSSVDKPLTQFLVSCCVSSTECNKCYHLQIAGDQLALLFILSHIKYTKRKKADWPPYHAYAIFNWTVRSSEMSNHTKFGCIKTLCLLIYGKEISHTEKFGGKFISPKKVLSAT